MRRVLDSFVLRFAFGIWFRFNPYTLMVFRTYLVKISDDATSDPSHTEDRIMRALSDAGFEVKEVKRWASPGESSGVDLFGSVAKLPQPQRESTIQTLPGLGGLDLQSDV